MGRRSSKNRKSILNDKEKRFLISIIALIVIIIIISIVIKHRHSENEVAVPTESQLEELENEKMVEKLADMNERTRIEYYFAIFINYIESEQYEEAYNLLYDEFKKTYFPTLDDFEKYVKEKFPKMMNIEHENIERNGEIYVLWVYISDLVNGGPEDKQKLNIVIKENDLNDFVMSFSVI